MMTTEGKLWSIPIDLVPVWRSPALCLDKFKITFTDVTSKTFKLNLEDDKLKSSGLET